ncbi:MAG TPA: porin family protein [Chitinophagaceae bacterium]|nr:porin family protein [Chitinophagaceae bacterium]
MKKFVCAAVAVAFLSVNLSAQRVNFGIKAGIQNNLLHLKEKSGDDWSRASYSGTGFQVGGIADISITEHFSIQPNLLFSMKGVKPSSLNEITLYTVDLPVNFLYKSNGFFAGIGPNLSYGISAKSENDVTPDDDLYEGDGSDPAEFNRFEFGANVVLGYQFNCGVALNTHFTPGYSNLNNQDDADETRYNTRIYGFSVSYMFGGNKSAKKK